MREANNATIERSPLFFITAEILWGIVLTKFWQKFGVKQSHIS
ncbi:unnamed protein product [Acanthoscelides obtectus]|uniref:Uncharacterized protein n=1 Tax=Acanthoscelides obtectus TaxID=200917 RepID=A0A9P0QAG6_ACAOB|nr:unnamed protein product [Acanthoscelides obtectus]CAK1627277.1 hypothetical protein AOBTE_LOCUS4471 [Acanthoscelides obtectus]